MAFMPLRVVTQRLSNTPAEQLPRVAPILAGQITDCRESINSQLTKANKSVYLHKLKTQVSALLQDRSPGARYAAIILIKAALGLKTYDILEGTAPWVKGLIGILGVSKPNAFILVSPFLIPCGCLDIKCEIL